MQNELQITIQDMPASAALESKIRDKVAKLERMHPRLTSCRVSVAAPHRHQHRHRLLAVTLLITFPGGEVAVTRDDNEDVYVLVRDAFAAAERELGKYAGHLDKRAAAHHDYHPDDSANAGGAHRE